MLSLVFKPNVAPRCLNKGNLSLLRSSSCLHCLVWNCTLHFTLEIFIIYVLNFNLYYFSLFIETLHMNTNILICFFKMLSHSLSLSLYIYIYLDSTTGNCFSFGPCPSLLQEKNSFLLHFPHSNSVQFSHSFLSDSLRPHELQHARPPCPSPTPRAHPNSCPSS